MEIGAALRAAMPALANKTYFNYGGQGPLPGPSLEAITAIWRQIQTLGPFTSEVWPLVEGTMGALRQRLAGWMGVSAARLAFTENVTSGCVLPLWGLPWRDGDQLLISDCEHPGVVAACRELARRHRLELRTLVVRDLAAGPEATEAVLLQRLEDSLQPRTRLVVLSHLLWNTGQLMPIARVARELQCHANQPWLLVDAAQGLGAIPVAEAAAAADIYACTGHKWCCGPEGLGVVALSRRLLNEAQPTLIGWRSLSHEGSMESAFHADARRFEVATSCVPLFAGLNRSLELLEAEGDAQQRLESIRSLAGALWQRLGELPGVVPLLEVPPPAGLVSFTVAGQTPEALVRHLGERRIWLRSLDDPHCLRACTHITTTPGELDQLASALAELIHQP